MSQSFFLRSINSDLSVGGALFNRKLLEDTGTAADQVVNLSANQTVDGYAFTEPGVPHSHGGPGDYTVSIHVTAGATQINNSVRLARVDSDGAVQAEGGFSTPDPGNAGVKVHEFESFDLGTWNAGDRLRVQYRFENTDSMMARSLTIELNTVETELITPWVGDGPDPIEGSGTVVSPAATVAGVGETAGADPIEGSGAVVAPAAAAAGTADTPIVGTGALSAPAAATSGAGTVGDAPTADTVVTDGVPVTTDGVAWTTGGEPSDTVEGSGQAVAPAADLDGAATIGVAGAGAAVTAPAVAIGAGSVTAASTGEAAAPAVQTSGSGTVDMSGDGAATAPPAMSSGSGNLGAPQTTGAGAVTAAAAISDGAGKVTVDGDGQTAAPPAQTSGTGAVGGAPIAGSGTAAPPAADVAGAATVTVGCDGAATSAAALVAGAGDVLVLGDGTVLAPAAFVFGSDAVQQPRPLAIFDEQERQPRHDDLDRPARHQTVSRPARWDEDDRPPRHTTTVRGRTWPELTRPQRHHDLQRPARFRQTVFVREEQPMAHITVTLGPFTQHEVPEPLYVRVHETLRDGTPAPLELHGQTPAWTAEVSVQAPGEDSSQATTRSCVIVDPADLPVDEPQNFDTPEDGWVRVDWEDGDFAATGETKVQLTLDNGVLRLKSTAVYSAQVHDGPAALVGAPV